MAEGSIRLFTDEQWARLTLLLGGEKHTIINSVQKHTEHTYMAPETYIARVPENGIPPFDQAGTGTSTDDAVGSVECDICKIENDGLVNAGFTKTIYNLGSVKIRKKITPYVPVTRDKFGSWIVANPIDTIRLKAVTSEIIAVNSSGSVVIKIDGVSEDTVTAHLNWTTGGEDISADKEIWIRWCADEKRWVIDGADCELPP